MVKPDYDGGSMYFPVIVRRCAENGCYLSDSRLENRMAGEYRRLYWVKGEPHVRLYGELRRVSILTTEEA